MFNATRNQNILSICVFFAVIILYFLIHPCIFNKKTDNSNYPGLFIREDFVAKDQPDKTVKKRFDYIYQHHVWTGGDGSGMGSSIEQTRVAHKVILEVINEYEIKSMFDAPCGSFLWMSNVMREVKAQFEKRGERFRYHGVDVVESVIEKVKNKYQNESDDWEFSLCDFTTQKLPEDYELIFSRDALMHLSYAKVLF